jgi:hypothetical protein
MANSLVSIAVMEPFDGQEKDFLGILSELYALMERKQYSRDILLRNRQEPPVYFHIRYWASPDARLEAQEDPEVHRCWARLAHVCLMRRVHETLDEVDWRGAEPAARP